MINDLIPESPIRAWVERTLSPQEPSAAAVQQVAFYLLLVPLVESTLRRTADGSHQYEIEQLIRECEAEVRDEPREVVTAAAINRLNLPCGPICLDESTELRPLTDQDKQLFIRAKDPLGCGPSTLFIQFAPAIVEIRQQVRPSERPDPGGTLELLSQALHLFKAGGFDITSFLSYPTRNWAALDPWISQWSDRRSKLIGPNLTINSNEAPRLRAFWAWLKGSQPNANAGARIALRRFKRASEDRPLDDRLIDLCIGLDALVGPDGAVEASYRVALRTASLLGHDESSRERIWSLLRGLYKLRGRIVHGGLTADRVRPRDLPSIDGIADLSGLLEESSRLLAQLLRGWLALPEDHRSADVLEKNVREGGSFVKSFRDPWIKDPTSHDPPGGPPVE